MSTREKLVELRAAADRLALGDYGDRLLRALVIDLIDVMCGVEPSHPDLANARQAPPAPELVGVKGGVQGLPPALAVGGAAAPRAIVAPVIDAPAPTGTVPDPAGTEWIEQLERERIAKESEQQNKTNGGH